MVMSKDEAAVGVLVEHLKQLALTPNQFQHHAAASLRLLDRQHRRRNRKCLGVKSAPGGRESPRLEGGCSESDNMDDSPSPPIKEAMSAPTLTHSPPEPKLINVASLPLLAARKLNWPPRVLEPLESVQSVAARQDVGTCPATTGLAVHWGSFKIPHPRKAETGGEDSHFISPSGCAAGVADGVGEWEWRFGLNPRAFADELMSAASDAAECFRRDSTSGCGAEVAAAALSKGFDATHSYGSATSLVVSIGGNGDELGVANLGDSGLRQIRRPLQWGNHRPAELETRIVNRTNEQQHTFNCPFQLARLPKVDDFRRLQAEGKGTLVRAVKNSANMKRDMPADADLYTFLLQEGDLVVLGTDGVFDNLNDREVCELADLAVSPYEAGQTLNPKTGSLQGEGVSTDPTRLAESIANAAFLRSTDASAKTPFSMNARDAGFQHFGGKMDDITLVVGWVVKAAE